MKRFPGRSQAAHGAPERERRAHTVLLSRVCAAAGGGGCGVRSSCVVRVRCLSFVDYCKANRPNSMQHMVSYLTSYHTPQSISPHSVESHGAAKTKVPPGPALGACRSSIVSGNIVHAPIAYANLWQERLWQFQCVLPYEHMYAAFMQRRHPARRHPPRHSHHATHRERAARSWRSRFAPTTRLLAWLVRVS